MTSTAIATPFALPLLPQGASAEEILCAGVACAPGAVALACSFSVEDIIIIDLLQTLRLPVSVFALDTGRLNEETYEVAEALRERFGLRIDWFFPERADIEQLERDKGLFSFRDSLANRLECCQLRKVRPLQRALAPLAGWITGMRREQGLTRNGIEPIECDDLHNGILKLNPLCHWSAAAVENYVRSRQLPVNRLHQQGYPSIGCAPCTRAIQTGEGARAGRWWWENPEHKECGLHKK